MWLNLGCGQYHAPAPWVNVDANPITRPDVVADIAHLPWPDHTAERIYCGHVLEHVPPDDVVAVLMELRRLLAPGGELCIVGPDYDRALANPVVEEREPLLRSIRDGGGRWSGDEHLWLSTEAATLGYVRSVFLSARTPNIADVDDAVWPVVSHVWWQFAITA